MYSLEKKIIAGASCLDEKLTFSGGAWRGLCGEIRLIVVLKECSHSFRGLFIALVDPLDEYGFHEVFFSI